jgi:hypothetical protein
MADLDRYERRYEPAPRDRPARSRTQRKKGGLPKPVARIGGALLGIIILIIIIILSARACARSGEENAYREYMTEVGTIVAQSDEIGAQLEELLRNPGDISRADVQTRLESFSSQCRTLEEQAMKLAAPNELNSRGVHQIFVLVLSFRAIGTESLKTYLLSALELEGTTGTTETAIAGEATTTTTVPSALSPAGPADQISYALRYMTTSDFLYKEVFETRTAQILAEKRIPGVVAPSSQFMNDPEIASLNQVQSILTAMKTTGSLQAVHGVALKGVLVQPDGKQLVQGGTYDLAASGELTFIVTVENQGNMDEVDVPVVITLASETTPEQRISVLVSTMKAKDTETVPVTGLNPTAYGEVATLTVTVGPVPEERYSANNTMTANVIFKL